MRRSTAIQRATTGLATGLTLLTLSTGAAAQIETVSTETVSPGAERASVVIYRDRPVDTAGLLARANNSWDTGLRREGLALIVETRTIDLPAGEAVIRFRGVADGMVPQTATLDGLPAQVVERNTDFDLLTPAALLEKSVGERVQVVRTNPATGQQVIRPAIVRSGANGTVLEVDGQLEALSCSGLTERIIFDRLPEGLSDQPVLSVRTRAPTAGRYVVTLAYLATGLQWSSDYVARLNPDGRTMDLTGWITLANFGGTGFRNAPVQVVAGELNRDADTVPVDPVLTYRQPACWPQDTTTDAPMFASYKEDRVEYNSPPMMVMAPAPSIEDIVVTGSRVRNVAEMAELGDYKLYTLPGRTDVNARQTKQVRFLEQDRVAYTRLYQARIEAEDDGEPAAPTLMLRLRNRTADGLGLPLPGGSVSLMEGQAGQTLLTGQARFNDKGVGLPVELAFAQAMDLTIRHEIVSEDNRRVRAGRSLRRVSVRAVITNDKPEPVEVEVVPQEGLRDGFRIVSSSTRPVLTDAGVQAWRLRVPAGRQQTLDYAIEWDD